jgi:hypothetical protein
MTDEQHDEERATELIEDLEAPATAQGDVAGGAPCSPTCAASVVCFKPTCQVSRATCEENTGRILVFEV